MKKNNIFYLYLCAAALMFAACQKEGPAQENAPAQSGNLDVITATTSSTKIMTQDGMNVLWDKGDKVELFTRTPSGSSWSAGWCDYNSTLEAPSAEATFVRDANNTNTVDNTSGVYVAAYIKGETSTRQQSRNYNVGFALDKAQVAKNGGDFVSSLMVATSKDTQFQFQHLVSYIKFTVGADTTPFTKLEVCPVAESEYITSRIYLDFAEEPVVSVRPTNPSSGNVYSESQKTMSVTTDDAAAFKAGVYYFAINPSTYTEGLSFTFENADGKQITIVREGRVEMTAGSVADMGTIGILQFEGAQEPKKLELATVFEENGTKQGVVFWIDPENPAKGKIVSVTSSATAWSSLFTNLGGTNTSNGIANFVQITSLEAYLTDPNTYPVTKYCADLRESLGGNWYVPVASELQSLYNTYYGLTNTSWTNNTDYRKDGNGVVIDMTPKRKFDEALANLSDTVSTTLDGDADADGTCDNAGFGTGNGVKYWTSKENSGDGKIQYVRFGNYQLSTATKTTSTAMYVRCVRDVELK